MAGKVLPKGCDLKETGMAVEARRAVWPSPIFCLGVSIEML